MNPTQYLYVARLVPLGKELPVVDLKEGPVVEYFDSCAFALAREKPRDVKLLLDHDDRRVAGRFSMIRADGPWLVGTFTVDLETTPGVIAYDRLKVGTPISVGFTRHNDVP
jgi:phage head maturation protease